MKTSVKTTLKSTLLALSIAGLGFTSHVQAHAPLNEIIPYYYFFYDLEYAPRNHHRHGKHLVKKHHRSHHGHHKPNRSHHRSHHKPHRKAHSHDHYSRYKPRKHKQHHDKRGGKRIIKKHKHDD